MITRAQIEPCARVAPQEGAPWPTPVLVAMVLEVVGLTLSENVDRKAAQPMCPAGYPDPHGEGVRGVGWGD